MRKQTVIVSGSEGFVGKLLVKRLEALDIKVLPIDSKTNIDLMDWPALKDLDGAEDSSAVFHLAGITYVPYAWENPREVYETNVLSTLNLLELCRTKKIKKFIFISSYVYGRPQYQPIDENHPLDPFNPYARSKIISEELCRGFGKDYGLQVVILRPFNLFGPGQNQKFLIPSICRQIIENKHVILEDPRPKRDFLYVDDMVDALIDSLNFNGSALEIFNLGSGKSHSVSEVVEQAISVSGIKVDVEFQSASRMNEVMDTQADISKAKKMLNWEPTISLQEGLGRILKDLQ